MIYVYGPAEASVEEISGAEKALFIHHDQQASTRMLTDATGIVRGTRTYEPYGKQSGSTGTATTPLGYDGQYTNSDTGLIYLRARSYDLATMQFMSVDPAVGSTRAPYRTGLGPAFSAIGRVGPVVRPLVAGAIGSLAQKEVRKEPLTQRSLERAL